MRFLLRLGVLALAAVGAKALYDQFAPKAAELKGPAGDVLGTAKSAARDVTQHAKDAAAEVADDARQKANDVKDQASAAADQAQDIVSDDAPTVATPKTVATPQAASRA
jgi:Sec-independent protein translocase protein TatA